MFVPKLLYDVGGASIKPDDCIVKCFTSPLIPCHSRFTLVRNSNSFHVRGPVFVIEELSAVSFKYFILAFYDVAVDHFGIMFTPSRMMRDLFVRARGRVHNLEVLVN